MTTYRFRCILRIAAAVFVLTIMAGTCPQIFAAEKTTLDITGYKIDAELSPKDHKLTATTSVTFTALEDLPTATFELHGALRVEKVTDASGKPLNGERGANASLLVT